MASGTSSTPVYFRATSGQPPFPAHPVIGRCIYCPEEGTTDEHIIPLSLGGKLLLRDASCDTCREITRRFEEAVTRDMYWPLRLRLGIMGSRKRRKERLTHWPAVLIDNDRQEEMPIGGQAGPALQRC